MLPAVNAPVIAVWPMARPVNGPVIVKRTRSSEKPRTCRLYLSFEPVGTRGSSQPSSPEQGYYSLGGPPFFLTCTSSYNSRRGLGNYFTICPRAMWTDCLARFSALRALPRAGSTGPSVNRCSGYAVNYRKGWSVGGIALASVFSCSAIPLKHMQGKLRSIKLLLAS